MFPSCGLCSVIYWEGDSWEGIQDAMPIGHAKFEMPIIYPTKDV